MNLQLLQTSLLAIIKSRHIVLPDHNNYLHTIQHSENLLLIRKIGFWWRKIQTEQYCVLTTNLLKLTGRFDEQLSGFISEKGFSSFREEVGVQFLKYVISKEAGSITQSVAEFEYAVIRLKLGETVEESIAFEYEPYSVIRSLLHNTINMSELKVGRYEVTVSSKYGAELFRVMNIGLN